MSFFGSRNSILVFTIITAIIHLGLGFVSLSNPDFLGDLFILNGIGYFALMYALLWKPSFLQGQEGLVRWAFLAYTALTFVLYFVFNGAQSFMMDGRVNFPGLLTKFDELLLMVSIWQYKS